MIRTGQQYLDSIRQPRDVHQWRAREGCDSPPDAETARRYPRADLRHAARGRIARHLELQRERRAPHHRQQAAAHSAGLVGQAPPRDRRCRTYSSRAAALRSSTRTGPTACRSASMRAAYSLLATKPANNMSYDGRALVTRPLASAAAASRLVLATRAGVPLSPAAHAFADKSFFGVSHAHATT